MSRVVSIELDGPTAAKAALEQCIASGGVAVFPADGLYGLACDPLNAEAIARIHALKGRDDHKPSAVMYFSPLSMRELVGGLGERTTTAFSSLLPGPVTLVIANPDHRYPLACRQNPERLGVRLVDGPLAGAMCPIFQTSANRSGAPATKNFDEVPRAIRLGADLAIDGGVLTGMASTVVDLTALDVDGTWTVLRQGALPLEDLEAALSEASTNDGVSD